MNNLQIFDIRLQDYRQYYGEITIDLATDKNRNINVIEGQNGAGKSNILNGITLCLYGEEMHTNAQGSDDLETDPYVTKRKLEGLSPGETVSGEIEITLGKESPKYAFQRSFTTARIENDTETGEPEYTNSLGDLSLMQRFGGSDWQPISRPENVLREILPTHVHQYFFFDGEQLDEFFAEGYSNRVQRAVMDVSHVELLNNAGNHLGEVQSEYERESAIQGGDVAEIKRKKDQAKEELERLKDRHEELDSDLQTAEKNLADVNDKLSTSGNENVRELQERREALEGKIEVWDDQLTESRADTGSSLCQAGSVAYNADALAYGISALEEHESEQGGTPGLTEELLDHLIDRGECLCGEPLADGNDAREHLESLHNDMATNGGNVIDGRLQMKRALNAGDDKLSTLLEKKGDLEELRSKISNSETELGRIADKLEDVDSIDSERAAELEARRQDISSRIQDINRELGELDNKIEQQTERFEDYKDEWQEAANQQKENQLLVEKALFVDSAVTTVDEIKQDILDQVRSQTEERLEQYYNDLIWKDEVYEITLTKNYEVKLHDQDGRKNLGSLAAGERQVLALSFMASLSKISGFDAPIVIDTPLGRISSDPKQRIAQNVPNYLEDTQVTFLMTDVEYSEDVRAFIENEVANEYHLQFSNGTTEVTPL